MASRNYERIHRLQRPVLPRRDLWHDLLTDFADQLWRNVYTEKNRKLDSGYMKASGRYQRMKKSFANKWSSAMPEEKAQIGTALRKAKNEMFTHPYYAQCNSGYKCLYYCRYVDDFIISVIGSRKDAERIKADVKAFLMGTLKLEMSEEKAKITHVE